MNCREFWENIPERLDHLGECPACAALHRREERLASSLRSLGAELRRVEAPARVERRLVKAFRGRAAAGPARSWGWWGPVVTWGSAVALTAAMAVLLVRDRQPQPVRRAPRNTIQLAVAGTSNDVEAMGALTGAYDDFIPLPNAEEIAPNEEVDVVRVEVPRSAMLTVGLPVNEEQASERVEADVVLGADGTARAVRFLDE
jgi:hypothetical protein